MQNAIDVKYETVTALEEKSLGELGSEVNLLYRESVQIGNIALTMMAQAGQRLIVIKDRLPHGEFEEWCDQNLDFSKRKAEGMMKFARKVADENSLFSKTQTFADIGISRVWALLSAPEEVASEVLETNNVAEMTVRELKEELQRVKEENAAAEERRQSYTARMQEELSKLEREKALLESEPEEATAPEIDVESYEKAVEDARNAEAAIRQELAAVTEKLEKAKDAAKKAKETAKKAKETAKKATEEKDAAVRKAVEDLRKEQDEAVRKVVGEKIAEETARLKADLAAADEEIEKLQKKLDNSSSEDFAIFKVQTKVLQEAFAQMLTCIDNIGEQDAEKAEKMRAAASKMMGILSDRL